MSNCNGLNILICYWVKLFQSNDIRFLTTLGSGDINCFIAGVENRTERASLGPFPSSTGLALVRCENTGGKEIKRTGGLEDRRTAGQQDSRTAELIGKRTRYHWDQTNAGTGCQMERRA